MSCHRGRFRQFAGLLAVALVCLVWVLQDTSARASETDRRSGARQRPNILLLVADDMAHTDLGIAGHPLVRTPNLDRLASGGVRFTHAFTPNPICEPSRAALLTGQDSWTNGCIFFGVPIRKSSPLWPRLLADAGYVTFYTGKWHNDGRPSVRGFTSGANVFRGGMGDHAHLPVLEFGSEKPPQTAEYFSSTLFANSAGEFLERYNGRQPFCLYVSFTAPHDPWMPPGKYADMYPPERVSLPANFMPRPPFHWFTDWHGTELRDEALMPFPRTPEGVRDVRSRYFGMITHLDAQIGRILDTLDEKQLADDTLVIFIADHGISLGAHGFSGKQTMYEEGIRLPMIVRYPRITRAEPVNSDLVSLVDIFPTVCEAAGLPVPERVEGTSLLGRYEGRRGPRRERLFVTFHSPTQHRLVVRAVRTTRYKYIHHLMTDEVELYDLQTDPHELDNLDGNDADATIQHELAAVLQQWRTRSEPPEILSRSFK